MKILIVDDSAHFRETVKKALAKTDHSIEIAEDGFKGLAMINEWKPDLIFTDVDMPKVNGIELTEIASSLGYTVIVMTGNNTLLDEAVSKVSGARDFIVKDENLARSILASCVNSNEE
jgi:CheY-like chemotaxis protein